MNYPHNDDSRERGREAHVTSQTRFGPRPVPRPGLEPGTTERDGGSMTSQILVYGGIGIMAAAATTAAVLATRKVAGAIAGSDEEPVTSAHPRSRVTTGSVVAPRFADLDPDAQEAVRRRVRAQAAADRERAAHTRATASRRRDLAGEITGRANDLTASLNGVLTALSGAVVGFRSVAAQASDIMREFSDTTDVVRGVIGGVSQPTTAPRPRRGETKAESELRADRMHRL